VIAAIAERQAAETERVVRALVEGALPRRLRWTVDHPRVLAALYRLWPSWRPRLVIGTDVGDGCASLVVCGVTPDGTFTVLHTSTFTFYA
jgi:hypothetical protein